jgi:alpha-D-ribose 1-methylphosphonate 5-triphosphate synthase subunit PhnH
MYEQAPARARAPASDDKCCDELELLTAGDGEADEAGDTVPAQLRKASGGRPKATHGPGAV